MSLKLEPIASTSNFQQHISVWSLLMLHSDLSSCVLVTSPKFCTHPLPTIFYPHIQHIVGF
jgi:hypothetical protein